MSITLMLLGGNGSPVAAQEKTPDLQMLLNLDLFGSQPSDNSVDMPSDAGSSAAGPSMLDQIRALNTLGYLNGGPRNQQFHPPPPTDYGHPSGYPDGREGPQ